MYLLILLIWCCLIYVCIQARSTSRGLAALENTKTLRSRIEQLERGRENDEKTEKMSILDRGHSEQQAIDEKIDHLRSRIEQLEGQNEQRDEKISSHSFELLDRDGGTRARLEASEEGPCLFLYGANKRAPVAFFGFGGEKYPEIGLFYSGGPTTSGTHNAEATHLEQADGTEARLAITDSQITLFIDAEGYPSLSMYARERETLSLNLHSHI